MRTAAGGAECESVIVAIDAGTSSVRALVFDPSGRSLSDSISQHPYSVHTSADGGVTFPATELFDLVCIALDEVDDYLQRSGLAAAAVGTSTFWHSLLGLDERGEPASPIFYWADTRSAPDAAALRQELEPDAVWQRTGCRLHSSYWPAKLRWLRRTEPETFAQIARWTSFAEFALAHLAGFDAGAATFCMASATGLLDVHDLDWDQEILGAVGISPAQLSPLADLGPAGTLQPRFAARWPALRSAAWFPALGDGACANVGALAVGPQRMALTVGTSAAMRMILRRSRGEDWSIPPGLWAYRLDRVHAVFGGALSNGGNLLRWIWDTTGTDDDDVATADAVAMPPDSTGLTLLPFLAGERSPGWYDEATAVFAGLTLDTAPGHLIRAAMEATAYRLAHIYGALSPLASPEHVIVANGGAVTGQPAWLQIIADTLGHEILALPSGDESTARGAALLAAVTRGNLVTLELAADIADSGMPYTPDPANHDRYQVGLKRQRQLEQLLAAEGFL